MNVRTALNPAGEIRAQLTNAGMTTCHCAQGTHAAFLKCIKNAIKALDASDRKAAAVKAIETAAKASACGKKKVAKKSIACCLPRTPTEDIVIGHVRAPVTEKAGTKKGGTSLGTGTSCLPTNPCKPAASPSGAFAERAR